MSHILADARKFTAAFKSGDSGSAAASRELFNLLLRNSLTTKGGHSLKLYGGDRPMP